MSVRVFRRGNALFMNLYNKATNIVEVNATPAELVPSTRDQTVYKTSMGEAERFARTNVANETQLEIRGADGSLVLQEPGFNTVVGVQVGQRPFAATTLPLALGRSCCRPRLPGCDRSPASAAKFSAPPTAAKS